VLETSRKIVKPTIPRLVFDGKKVGENREFEEYMKESSYMSCEPHDYRRRRRQRVPVAGPRDIT
jgi:formylmethanofuran dehydrogenase subunit D